MTPVSNLNLNYTHLVTFYEGESLPYCYLVKLVDVHHKSGAPSEKRTMLTKTSFSHDDIICLVCPKVKRLCSMFKGTVA